MEEARKTCQAAIQLAKKKVPSKLIDVVRLQVSGASGTRYSVCVGCVYVHVCECVHACVCTMHCACMLVDILHHIYY